MNSKFLTFKGLYGETRDPSIMNFIHSEPIETRSKLYSWEINEHIHSDLYQIFIITTGGGTLLTGPKITTIEPNSLIWIPPQCIHGFRFKADTSGLVLSIAEDYMQGLLKSFISTAGSKDALDSGQIHFFIFNRQLREFGDLFTLFQWVQDELIEARPHKKQAIYSFLQLLLITLDRNQAMQLILSSTDNQRALNYYLAFRQLIKKTTRSVNSVAQYAADLKISSVHLNRVCRSLVQKSALDVIHEHLILECKKYLLNTSYSIAEIAYLFNFTDPAYFARVFKRLTGVTPREFRK